MLHHSACGLAVLGAHFLLVGDCLNLVLFDGLLQRHGGFDRLTRRLGVRRQIVRGAVGTADALDPAERGLQFGVPAVARVVRHLIPHVLSEAEPGDISPDRHQELEDPTHEVPEGLVVHRPVGHSVAELSGLDRLAAHLVVRREHRDFEVRHAGKLGARFVLRVQKVLDLGHLELSHPEHAVPRRDFVAVGHSDLRAGKWQFLVVVIVEPPERKKDALSGLRPQKALEMAGRSNLGREHHVEVLGRRELVARG
mmetsp:Transcript_17506/g.45773  ORF Transcript_17506/g.45773 Transcript_17506/m.45773 type:complete len:253 (+) Transcript_17506:659-1417(+)